jgi:hypothetical protein
MADKEKIDKLYEDFSGFEKTGERKITLGSMSRLAFLGRAVAVEYEAQKHSDRKKNVYRHEFENPAIVASNGKDILILGGKIKVTTRGIEG